VVPLPYRSGGRDGNTGRTHTHAYTARALVAAFLIAVNRHDGRACVCMVTLVVALS